MNNTVHNIVISFTKHDIEINILQLVTSKTPKKGKQIIIAGRLFFPFPYTKSQIFFP